MGNRLENKIALITGGAAGFGKGTAAVLKREGAKVYISDINKEGGEKVASELGVSFFEHDVTDPERWQEVIAEIKTADNQLNILVNNAGIGYMGDVEGTTNEAWDLVHKVDLDSVFYGCKYALPLMRDSGNGSIINISSISATRPKGYTSYSASKGAVISLTKAMAVDHGADGIRVNCILPGPVYTPMVYQDGMSEKLRKIRKDASLLNVEGDGFDIGKAVVYLSSNWAKYITGQTLVVDGGCSLSYKSRG